MDSIGEHRKTGTYLNVSVVHRCVINTECARLTGNGYNMLGI